MASVDAVPDLFSGMLEIRRDCVNGSGMSAVELHQEIAYDSFRSGFPFASSLLQMEIGTAGIQSPFWPPPIPAASSPAVAEMVPP